MRPIKILMIAAMLAIAAACFTACDASDLSARSSPVVMAEKAKNTVTPQGASATLAAFGTAEVQAPAVAKLPQYDVDDLALGQPVREVHVRQSADFMPYNFALDNVPIERTAKLDGYLTAQLKPKISHTGFDHARAREKV